MTIGWQSLLAVLVGGGIGSVIRYTVTFAITQRFGAGFPLWTFIINITGSLIIGIVAEITQTRVFAGSALLRLFLMTGVLGGYTTFSTFSLDALTLMREGDQLLAFAYVAGSVVLGIAAAFGGVALVRAFSSA
ncbi:MAG TPA: fluoride efflux transporter CrcB [Candidatus Baltobacteraceae bacterium]|nr:fluoride efflux transporter CrcB [Candidatus Baltobacteraceae bacterium]